jgi:putative sterol carrier protein
MNSVKFLSKEWMDKAQAAIKQNLDEAKDMKMTTTSLLIIISDVPPNDSTRNIYISFKNGKLQHFLVDIETSTIDEDPEFIVSGCYHTFIQIIQNEINLVMALFKNQIRLKGDKMKAMQFSKPLEKINECLRQIQPTYDI